MTLHKMHVRPACASNQNKAPHQLHEVFSVRQVFHVPGSQGMHVIGLRVKSVTGSLARKLSE